MKKIMIVSLASVLTFSLYGCSTVALEKGPAVISDSSEDNIDITEPQEEKEQEDESNQDLDLSTETNLQENSEDTAAKDTDTSDSTGGKSTDVFTGIVMIEGMEEQVNYSTYQSEYGYQMNYDVDRFKVTSENGIDTFMAENINPEIYPYVFINIEKCEYPEGEKIDLSGNLQVLDKTSGKILSTNAPKENIKLGEYDAVHFEYIEGNQWNSLVRHIYVIHLEKNYYVISSNYFLEASEGYGARIKAMLDTIVIEE